MPPGFPMPGISINVADNATEKDQDLFVSASIDNQTTTAFHNLIRYGLTRQARADKSLAIVGKLQFGIQQLLLWSSIPRQAGYDHGGKWILSYWTGCARLRYLQLPDRFQSRSVDLSGRLSGYAAFTGAHRFPL